MFLVCAYIKCHHTSLISACLHWPNNVGLRSVLFVLALALTAGIAGHARLINTSNKLTMPKAMLPIPIMLE